MYGDAGFLVDLETIDQQADFFSVTQKGRAPGISELDKVTLGPMDKRHPRDLMSSYIKHA